MTHQLFTLGHSVMPSSTFLEILQRLEINLVIDVRSKPQSFRFPHFDQQELENSLTTAGIRYLFLGAELGGRPEDPKAYRSDGLVDYRALRKSRPVRDAIDRVLRELERSDVVLLCTEEDPLNCHRFLMICPELVAAGLAPSHIRKGGTIESQRQAEDRLLQDHHFAAIAGASLFFQDRGAALEDAYISQSKECAFRIDPRVLEPW